MTAILIAAAISMGLFAILGLLAWVIIIISTRVLNNVWTDDD